MLPCPKCNYDLTTLPDGLCPECGTAFNQASILRARNESQLPPVLKEIGRSAFSMLAGAIWMLPFSSHCGGPIGLVVVAPPFFVAGSTRQEHYAVLRVTTAGIAVGTLLSLAISSSYARENIPASFASLLIALALRLTHLHKFVRGALSLVGFVIWFAWCARVFYHGIAFRGYQLTELNSWLIDLPLSPTNALAQAIICSTLGVIALIFVLLSF
jgi:hypothetical protein